MHVHLQGGGGQNSGQEGAHLALLLVQPDDGDDRGPDEPPGGLHLRGAQGAGGLLHDVVVLRGSRRQGQPGQRGSRLRFRGLWRENRLRL